MDTKLAKLANDEGTFAIVIGADDDGLFVREQRWGKRPSQCKRRRFADVGWPDEASRDEIMAKAERQGFDLSKLEGAQ